MTPRTTTDTTVRTRPSQRPRNGLPSGGRQPFLLLHLIRPEIIDLSRSSCPSGCPLFRSKRNTAFHSVRKDDSPVGTFGIAASETSSIPSEVGVLVRSHASGMWLIVPYRGRAEDIYEDDENTEGDDSHNDSTAMRLTNPTHYFE